jgi:hypothetical protein
MLCIIRQYKDSIDETIFVRNYLLKENIDFVRDFKIFGRCWKSSSSDNMSSVEWKFED